MIIPSPNSSWEEPGTQAEEEKNSGQHGLRSEGRNNNNKSERKEGRKSFNERGLKGGPKDSI